MARQAPAELPAVPAAAPKVNPPADRRPGAGTRRLAVWLALLAVASAAGVYGILRWRAPAPQPEEPSVGCADERAARSAAGDDEHLLVFTNRRTEPMVVHWINPEGDRQRWFEVRPGASRSQRTPGSYRWLVSRPDGQCLQIVSAPGPVVVE